MNGRNPFLGKSESDAITSSVGFGCARLIEVADRKERMWLLDSALDAGILHFDTAPMYGYGNSEIELGEFVRGRRDKITITTKFGIEPTVLGRQFGRHRRLIIGGRSVLRRTGLTSRTMKYKAAHELERTSNNSDPYAQSTVDRMLFKRVGYEIGVVGNSLDRSLRSLGTDHVDCLLLHDPLGHDCESLAALRDYLELERSRGRIRSWGISGEVARDLTAEDISIPVRQFRDDIWDIIAPQHWDADLRITYGSIGRLHPILVTVFRRHPGERSLWEAELGVEMTSESLASILFEAALLRNQYGIVLFSTTNPSHLSRIASVATGEKRLKFTEESINYLVEGLIRRTAEIPK